MAAIFSRKTDMKATGVSTTIPDYDVCRLSYYLRCGTVSCGLDIIVDELVDYKNAHKLPRARQDAIFKLAYEDFDIETLANKTIFLDDENQVLPRGTSNEFYEISQVSNILAVQRDAIIGGEHRQVRKIMVCNSGWLERNYINPLQNNLSRLPSGRADLSSVGLLGALLLGAILADDSDESHHHCSHCRGSSGPCACKSGCPVKSSTQCSAARKHCSHCRGLYGTCSCEEGCPAKAESLCKVVHSGIMCDSCKTPSIEGPRYKCNMCSNYNLCQQCYNSGAHNKTHAFERYARVGSTATFLMPREELVKTKHCLHCDGADGKCKCTQGCVAKAESKCIVVHDVTCRGCHQIGIRGPCYKCAECWDFHLCQKCYDAGEHVLSHSFLRIARVGSRPVSMVPRSPKPSPSQVNDEIPVATATPVKGTTAPMKGTPPVKVTPVKVEVVSFEKGQAITLVNMADPSMTGISATVIKDMGNRVVIDVPSLSRRITVKPENVQLAYEPLAAGTLVELKNLMKEDMNGLLAVVTDGQVCSNGRIQVQLLDDESRTLKIKPENLESIEDM